MKLNWHNKQKCKIVLLAMLASLLLPGCKQKPALEGPEFNRIFTLKLMNGLSTAVTLTVQGYGEDNCYEGDSGSFPLNPGAVQPIAIARVQGHGCDGHQGYFSITPGPGGGQEDQKIFLFEFNNGGILTATSIPNAYNGSLSPKQPDESYTWTIQDVSARLSGPLDASLTNPVNRVAVNPGVWNSTSTVTQIEFQPTAATPFHNFYDTCSVTKIELLHPQHVVRLPDKNGRAYFVVSQSREHNGYINVLRSGDGHLDQQTDQIVRPDPGSNLVGEYIWQDVYTGRFNGTINPVGNWNHPGKMGVIGNVLIVAAQNWQSDYKFFCDARPGDSPDKVLFYDVRDPEHPRYWGAMSKEQLGVDEIATAGIARAPDGRYLLTAGGGGKYTYWVSNKISTNISDWTATQSPMFSGQHGLNFNTLQNSSGSVLPSGQAWLLYFDASDTNFSFLNFAYKDNTGFPISNLGGTNVPMSLPGAKRDWDTSSIYITNSNSTLIYTVKSDDNTANYMLYQVTQGAAKVAE